MLNKLKNFIILLVILILPSYNVYSQPVIIDWYRITAQNPPLNYNPTVTTNTFKLGYYNINPVTGEQRIWNPDVGSWQPGTLFATGTGGTTTNVNYNYINPNFTGDLDYSPEQFGAVHANLRFSDVYVGTQLTNILNYYNTQLNSGPPAAPWNPPFPWTTWIGGNVNPSDYIDWAAWQLCVKKAFEYRENSGFGIKAAGPVYYIGHRAIVFPPYDYGSRNPNITIVGNYSKIISTGVLTPSFANAIFFRRTQNLPNHGLSFAMMNLAYISNLTFVGTSNDIGIAIGPTYGGFYQNIRGENLKTVIFVRFGLRTLIENCVAINCRNGFFAGTGNWPAANDWNSQSNHTTMVNCRYYNTGIGDTAFAFFSSSGCLIKNCVIESNGIDVGIHNNNYQNPTVKEFDIDNVEFNINTPPVNGAINVRANQFAVRINNVKSQKPALMVKAILQAPGTTPNGNPWGAAGGNTKYTISNISRWVGVNVGGVTKYFRDEVNTNSWKFVNNDGGIFGLNDATIQSWFIGPPGAYIPNRCTTINNIPPNCVEPTFVNYPLPR